MNRLRRLAGAAARVGARVTGSRTLRRVGRRRSMGGSGG